MSSFLAINTLNQHVFPYLLEQTYFKRAKNFSKQEAIGFLIQNMTSSSAQWAFAFGVVGNIISFGVFLSPLPTFYQIYKKKSTEGFQSVPYVIGLFSAMLWIYYAFLKSNTTLLITINSFGVFIETIYICFFLFYATKKARIDTVKLLMLFVVVGFGLIILLTHFLAKGSSRAHIVGWICLVFSLSVFLAPLFIVRQVIRTKSVEYMPFALSAFLTLSAVVWFFYGLLIKDYNIAIPNVFGFVFGVLQMVLYQIYNKPEKVIKEQKLPEVLADQIIIVDEHKLSEKAEQVIDMTKLDSLEKIPVVLRRSEDSDEILKDQNLEVGNQTKIVV